MKHNIVLKGYGAYLPTTPSKLLRLGTAESYGIEQIHITPSADWEDLLIKATFHPPSGDSVIVILGEDGIIDVPPEATAVAAGEHNPGLIVFSGAADGVQRISADIAYTVLGHAPVDGKDSEPTLSQWEQLAAAYQSKIDKQQGAENAGKVLGIDEDGMVKPVEKTGGNGYVLTEADKQEIAREAANKVKIPTTLPNPNALIFTGAASGTYDGSAPLTVEIPEGGSGGGEKEWEEVANITLHEEVNIVEIPTAWAEWKEAMFYLTFVAPTANPLTSAGTVRMGEGYPYTSAIRPINLDKAVPTSGKTEFVVLIKFYHDFIQSGYLDISFSVHNKRRDTSSSVTHSMLSMGQSNAEKFFICSNGKDVYFGVGTIIRVFAR